MIELASFSEHRIALAFSDYLTSQGIANHVDVEPDRFAIVLKEDADAGRAQAELKVFLENPADPRYRSASWTSGQTISTPLDPDAPGVGEAWRRFILQTGPATLIGIAWCLLSFAALQLWGDAYLQAMTFPADLNKMGTEYWRLLTPVLLNVDAFGLLINLMWWYLLGNLIEKSQSSLQLAAVAVTVSLASNMAQFMYNGHSNLFGGLSAVVYGLLGYIWLYPLVNPRVRFRVRGAILAFMLGWLVIGFMGTLDAVVGRMSNHAHLAGLLTGMALGLVFGLSDRFSRNGEVDGP